MAEQMGLLANIGQGLQRKFGRIGDALSGQDQNARDRLALGLMSLGNPQQTQAIQTLVANRLQERKKQAQANKSIEYLRTIDPRLAAMAENNPGMITSIFSELAKKQLNPQQPRFITRDGITYYADGPNKGKPVLEGQLTPGDQAIVDLQTRLGVDYDTAAKMYYQKQGFNIPGEMPSELVDSETMKKLFPNEEIAPGLYNLKRENGVIVGGNKVGGSGTTVNVGGEDNPQLELDKKLFERQGISFGKILDAGSASAQTQVELNILQQIAPFQPSGPVTGRLARLFPEANNLAAVRESIVKKIAPALRVDGSGSTSDIEFAAMINSYGSLLNTPEANAAILSVFQAKVKFNIDRAQIVREYMTSSDPNKLQIANQKLEALESYSSIPQQVQAILTKYQNTAAISDENPSTMTWDPSLNNGMGGFK